MLSKLNSGFVWMELHEYKASIIKQFAEANLMSAFSCRAIKLPYILSVFNLVIA